MRNRQLYLKDIFEAMGVVVWDTLKVDIPRLQPIIRQILEDMEKESA